MKLPLTKWQKTALLHLDLAWKCWTQYLVNRANLLHDLKWANAIQLLFKSLSHSTFLMRVSIELFVSLCVSGLGYGTIDLLYICPDHPINLSFWNVIIFEAWRQDAHWQRSNTEPNDLSEESDRPQFAGRWLWSGRASVWSLFLLSGWIRALIAVASYSYRCIDWGNLFKTSNDPFHTWYEHRMAAQDYLHFSRH